MARKKRQRFKEVHQSPFVIEDGNDDLRKSIISFIDPKKRVVLEVGCGRGEYTTGLAQLLPTTQYIGVDIQGERLWFGVKEIEEKKLENVLLVRMYIDHLARVFEKRSVDEIWITFPDPFPEKSRAKKRLTSQKFLEIYEKILKPGGVIHLKTDNQGLYEWSNTSFIQNGWRVVHSTKDIDSCSNLPKEVHEIKTQFEKKHREMGDTITYIQVQKDY